MRRIRGGFTLIELLVVIAIIAILAAILFPVFARAKESGRRAVCTSNMHQIFVGLSGYLDHYNDVMPPSAPINSYPEFEYPGQPIEHSVRSDWPNPMQIHFLLAPYITGKAVNTQNSYDTFKIFHCPTDSIVPPLDGSGNFDKGSNKDSAPYALCTFPKYGSSYQWRLGRADGTIPSESPNRSPNGDKATDLLSGMNVSAFRSPSKLGAARDAQTWHAYTYSHARRNWDDPVAGGNVLFLDGHVQFNRGGEFQAGIY